MARRKKYDLICLNPECGKPYKGQLGQLYCSKECTTDVSNANKRKLFSKINSIQLKNFRVLEKQYVLSNPNQVFSIKFLRLKGLNTDYFTSIHYDEEKKITTYEVYNYGFSLYKEGVIISKK